MQVLVLITIFVFQTIYLLQKKASKNGGYYGVNLHNSTIILFYTMAVLSLEQTQQQSSYKTQFNAIQADT